MADLWDEVAARCAAKPTVVVSWMPSHKTRQEHKDLVDSIRAGKPIVELAETADSSLTAVMGRLAAYTGQQVDWDFITQQSTLDLFPKELKIDESLPIASYAVPGVTKL